MKKIIHIFFVVFAFYVLSFPQNINGRISSSLYTFERFETEQVSNQYYRTYQMLILNLNKDFFSLRTYMNLEDDISKKLKYDPRLRVYNLYLEFRDILETATLKVGRQPIYNSITGGTFDGGFLGIKYKEFKLNAFYGANTPPYQKLELSQNWSDDFILGADFSAKLPYNFNLSLNYVNKNFKSVEYKALRFDDDLNPIDVLIRSKSLQYHFASAKLNYELPKMLDITAKYDFDLNYKTTSKIEIFSEYKATSKINVDLYYNYREPKIRYNSIFSVFDYGNSQEIEIGGGYKILEGYIATARFGYVKYEDENSSRVNIGLNSKFGSFSYRKSFGYAGELDAVSIYSGYSLFEGKITPSLGLSYTSYKSIPSDDKNQILTLLAGLNFRPYRILSADLQGQFMNNRIYKNDFRLLFKVNYWFNTNLSLL